MSALRATVSLQRATVDGNGCWRDNVFIERFRRLLKYEEVYLQAYASCSGARVSIGRYIAFYNSSRTHSSLVGRTPHEAYLTPSAALAE